MSVHLVLMLMQMDVVEDIVENKDLDFEVLLLVRQMEEHLIIVPLRIEKALDDNTQQVVVVEYMAFDFVVLVVAYIVFVDQVLLSSQLLVPPNVVNEVVFDIPNTLVSFDAYHQV